MRRSATQSAGAWARGPGEDAEAAVMLRCAVFDDAPDLLRLAQLDSAQPLREPILVAAFCGRITAALSLADGRAIADPFVPSAGAIELLRARARQLDGTRPRWEWRRRREGRQALLRVTPP